MEDLTPDHAEQDAAETLDNVVPTRGYQMLPMVGLGGSAGGIAALQAFFASVRPDTGMAFVVIMHLSAEHDSILAEILQRSTAMKVLQVTETEKVLPDTVYVIPPRKALTTIDGHIRVTDLPASRTRHVAVDLFFRTLADMHGPHAAAIVLSGGDSDGAIGIKRIKERGGLTIAQDPQEAEQGAMPRAAIATGMIDWVLPVAEMAAKVVEYFKIEQVLQLPPEDHPPHEPAADTAEASLRDVLGFVRTRTGRDFSVYKRATVLRRIGRRMQVNGVQNLRQYLQCLRTLPGEAAALVQDLLISVTNFFRDGDCFRALEAELPNIFAGKSPNDTVRAWVAACATGEEAYSVAILLSEHARRYESPPLIQVFATDLDEEAIRTAREGIYPVTIEADVSEDRLRRHFLKDAYGYRVRREIREMVLFAAHDLLKDSPFSRLDLVSCRNLMIYLRPEAQARLLETFHFALRPDGRLFLGTSETADEDQRLFAVVDKKCRLYAQRPAVRAPLPVPSGQGVLALALEAQQKAQAGPVVPGRPFELAMAGWRALRTGDARAANAPELHLRLLEKLAPPSVLVDADYDILHLSPSAGRFLQLAGGEPSRNLLRNIHPDLRIELRAGLLQASQAGGPVEVQGARMQLDGIDTLLDLRIVPFTDQGAPLLLVLFEANAQEAGAEPRLRKRSEMEPVARQLDNEIERLKEHLRTTVEQYESSAEDLKASNEELQAMNEELRAATEELETSREELQSINEELSTVNLELKRKVDELGQANSDLHNLMGATDIATVFLDRALSITRYTPSAVAVFNLIPTDIGRPLTDLTTRLDYPQMSEDAQRVLDRLAPVEREVGRPDGSWFLARLLPYRTMDDRIAGVVLCFIDITQRRQAEERLRASEERLRMLVENASEFAIFSTDLRRKVTSWNPGAQRLLGYSEAEMLGKSADVVFTPEDRAAGVPAQEMRTAMEEGRAIDDRTHMAKDGRRFWSSGALMLMRDRDGNAQGFVRILRDQSTVRESRRALEQSEANLLKALDETERARAQLQNADAAKDRFIAVLSHELRNPLASITSAADLLLLPKAKPAHRDDAVQVIRRQTAAMKGLLDDLLDASRMTLGRLVLHKRVVPLAMVMENAVETVRYQFGALNHELAVTLPPAEVQVEVDPLRMAQVLSNLLANAAKYTLAGGRITLGAYTDGGQAVVTVADNGIGMEPAELEHLFEMFFQSQAAQSKAGGGLGIGLSLVRSLVDLHGGSVSAASAGPGRGSSFTVRLPLAEGPQAPASRETAPSSAPVPAPPAAARLAADLPPVPQAASPAGEGSAAAARGRRILIADDNSDTAWGLQTLLEHEGYAVATAEDGMEAWAAMERDRPDIAILDIGMPLLSGLQLAQRVREQPWGANMLLIAATGWGQLDDYQKSIDAGFDEHLTKPVDFNELSALLVRSSGPRR